MAAPAGTYYIINRVLSPTGDKLALTFEGQGSAAQVTPLANAANQQVCRITTSSSPSLIFPQWVLSGGATSSVSPVSSQGLQAGWGSGVVILPAGGYVWHVTQTANGYT